MKSRLKPLRWVGSALADVKAFPEDVRRDIGYALYAAQRGELDPAAKPMKGFGGATVIEIRSDSQGGTWRTVYTVHLRKPFTYCTHSRRSRSAVSRLRESKPSAYARD